MKKLTIVAIALLVCAATSAQVGIGSPSPHPSARLDLDATDKGFLPPRLTTGQRNAIANPAEGLTIFNITTNCIEFWNETFWFNICCPVPESSSEITGPDVLCSGASGVTYTIDLADDLIYVWIVPGDWTITHGEDTNEITVTVGNDSGIVQAFLMNYCGNQGSRSTVFVTTVLGAPGQPSEISGLTNVCQGDVLNYSVDHVEGVDYAWTVPGNWTITGGQNTNEITVIVGSDSGNIEVTPSNICGDGTVQSLAISTTLAAPATPTAATQIRGHEQITWSWNAVGNAHGYRWNNENDFANSTDLGNQNWYIQTGLECDGCYTLYVWAYNTCGNSAPLVINETPVPCAFFCGNPVTFNYRGNNVTYGTVSRGGRCWMDRNLGASRVATSRTDSQAYGDLFQWGRLSDNHQARNSPLTTVTSSNDAPGHNSFIRISPYVYPYDWRKPQNHNLWNGSCGINNPCPQGWRVPTSGEYTTERQSWVWNNANGAFNSTLKFTMAGVRRDDTGGLYGVGGFAGYWSSSHGGTDGALNLGFNTSDATVGYSSRASGMTVRCIRNLGPSQPSGISGNSSPCQHSTGNVYSVTSVGGVSYIWNIPSDWSITSGAGTSSITVTAGTVSGTIEVIPYNEHGYGPSRTLSVTTTPAVPAQPSDITGDANPCQGSSQNYNVTNVSGVTYHWTFPTGWTQTGGGNSNSVTVTVGSNPGDITVTPSNSCGSGLARTLPVTTRIVPEQPSEITGDISPCQGESETYSVTNVDGVTYNWTFPTGWTQTDEGTSNSVTVTVGTGEGDITVTPSISGCNGTARILAATTTTVPAQPSEITGETFPTVGTTETYSITEVTGVSYAWIVPANWVIESGQGTHSIDVTVGDDLGNIEVTPSNDCGNGTSRTLTVFCISVPTEVVDVTNTTTGEIWMDRNLGATQVASSSSDVDSYGDLYQWGRLADGHQCRTSGTTTTLSPTDVPGHSNFITNATSQGGTPPYDWRSSTNNSLWQGVDGINNPCPSGYRLPTQAEWDAERASWSSQNAAGAYASPLKLPLAGTRGPNGTVYLVPSGIYWSYTIDGAQILPYRIEFNSTSVGFYTTYRACGLSVRCIKD